MESNYTNWQDLSLLNVNDKKFVFTIGYEYDILFSEHITILTGSW